MIIIASNISYMQMELVSNPSQNDFISPKEVQVFIDVVTLVVTGYMIFLVLRTALGGTVGRALQFITFGVAILALNHLADTLFLGTFLAQMGHVSDIFQESIVHRFVNLIAFSFLALGFTQLKQMRS